MCDAKCDANGKFGEIKATIPKMEETPQPLQLQRFLVGARGGT